MKKLDFREKKKNYCNKEQIMSQWNKWEKLQIYLNIGLKTTWLNKDGPESQVIIHITGSKISGRKIIKTFFFPKSLRFFLNLKITCIYMF